LFNIEVIIENTDIMYFEAVRGLESSIEVVQQTEIGSQFTQKDPGSVDYKNIVFVNGRESLHQIWDWRNKIEKGFDDKRNGVLRIMNNKGIDVAQFRFYKSWPARIRCGFDSDSIEQNVLIEELELTVEKWGPFKDRA